MKKKVVAFLSALIIPTVASAATPMRDGYWEMTTTMEMPGMPAQIPPTQMRHCFTGEDVRDYKKAITAAEGCTITDLKESGNKISWKMNCEGAGESTGTTVFNGDAFETTMTMQAEGMDMTVNVKAKRLGECP